MISPYHVQPAAVAEIAQLGKDVAVDFPYQAKPAVFPEFVSIADFNVRKILLPVIVEGGLIQYLVV